MLVGMPVLSAPVARTFGYLAAVIALSGVATCGCSASSAQPASPVAQPASPVATTPAGTASPPATRSPAVHPSSSPPASRPLAGKIVGIDPGHNGLNYTDPAFLDHQIWNGREFENCNTTGTQTASGYSEALFNFNVATYLVADLRSAGARVVLTRTNNHGIGPCVNQRAHIIDAAHADVAIDIHADGGPTWGRGFTVLEPVADSVNNKIIAASLLFGSYVHAAFMTYTPLRPSNYYGHNGYIFRNNLAGLNLTTVPEVLIECGNMPNAADAALLTSPAVQQRIARALETAIIKFLATR
jgi:N-acetylmuramoyl-L-alanine amidase